MACLHVQNTYDSEFILIHSDHVHNQRAMGRGGGINSLYKNRHKNNNEY
jgi:hypothetical protein